jgi:hypothetical protein
VDGQTGGISDGEKDRYDETNSHYSQFGEVLMLYLIVIFVTNYMEQGTWLAQSI